MFLLRHRSQLIRRGKHFFSTLIPLHSDNRQGQTRMSPDDIDIPMIEESHTRGGAAEVKVTGDR